MDARIFDVPIVRTTTIAAALLLLYKIVIVEEYVSLTGVLILIGSVILTAYLLKNIIDQESYIGHFTSGLIVYLVFAFALLFFKIVNGPLMIQKEIITSAVFGIGTAIAYYAIRRL